LNKCAILLLWNKGSTVEQLWNTGVGRGVGPRNAQFSCQAPELAVRAAEAPGRARVLDGDYTHPNGWTMAFSCGELAHGKTTPGVVCRNGPLGASRKRLLVSFSSQPPTLPQLGAILARLAARVSGSGMAAGRQQTILALQRHFGAHSRLQDVGSQSLTDASRHHGVRRDALAVTLRC